MMTDRSRRIELIENINEIIKKYRGEPLSPDDFNILWDLDLGGLLDVNREVRAQCRSFDIASHKR